MKRNVDLNEISDGRFYQKEDTVNISCDDCNGCSLCCRVVGDTILLDPYDIYTLSKKLRKTFAEMMEQEIELRIVDELVLPNLKMAPQSDACSFLSDDGRCKIHDARPGFCRLFPLGRIYDENNDFKYFVQTLECPYPNKGPVVIADWLNIPNLDCYESYIKNWHALLKNVEEYVSLEVDEAKKKQATMMLIRLFFEYPYDVTKDFYGQFYARLKKLS